MDKAVKQNNRQHNSHMRSANNHAPK